MIKEYCRRPYNRRAVQSLGEYLDRYGVLGVEGVDTRTLTLHLRREGAMQGVVSTGASSVEELLARVRSFNTPGGWSLVKQVSCRTSYSWRGTAGAPLSPVPDGEPGNGCHVVVYDLGVKFSLLRALADRGCQVTVLPASTTAKEILKMHPDGVLLSNGPGVDPAALSGLVAEVKELLGCIPLFGVCLGHQVLGLALGFKTFKLPFGHRGANQPVKELDSGRVRITAQNHGYCVLLEGGNARTRPTHVNLNDGTLEGLENRELRCFSVQFHPEGSPSPQGQEGLFNRFIEMMDGHRKELR